VLDGPLLLVSTNSVPSSVAQELDRLGATHAVILGGESAVGTAVEHALGEQLGPDSVERIAGPTRYETAEAVAKRVLDLQGDDYDGTALVATGGSFADGVAVAPLAAAHGWPLYLSHPTSGLRASTTSAMAAADTSQVIVLGGERAITLQAEETLVTTYGRDDVVRLGGTNRYETAARIASFGVAEAGLVWDRVGIATGRAYPDALSGGVLQGACGGVMLLTPQTTLASATRTALNANRSEIGTVTYFGGFGAVDLAVRNAVTQALEW
jgi:putative cell wall-binding protein